MATNPYVTIPAMPPWAQQAYLRAYLANYYQPKRPSTWDLVGTGFAGALTHGLDAMTKNWQLQSGLDQRTLETTLGQAGAMERQTAAFAQQDALQSARERAAAEQAYRLEQMRMDAEQRKAAQQALIGGTFWNRLGTPESIPQAPIETAHEIAPETYQGEEFGGSRPATTDDWAAARDAGDATGMARDQVPMPSRMDASGGAEPPVIERTSTPRPPLTRDRSVSEVLAGMGAYAGMVPPEMIGRAIDMEKARKEKAPAALSPEQQLKALELEYQRKVVAGTATEGDHATALRLGWIKGPSDKPGALGALASEYQLDAIATGGDTSSPLYQELSLNGNPVAAAKTMLAAREARNIREVREKALVEGQILDTRRRMEQSDEARQVIVPLKYAFQRGIELVPQVIPPGVGGAMQAGAKRTLQQWIAYDPNLAELQSLVNISLPASSRAIAKTVGAQSDRDIALMETALGFDRAMTREVLERKLQMGLTFAALMEEAAAVYESSGFGQRQPGETGAWSGLQARFQVVADEARKIKAMESAPTGPNGHAYKVGDVVNANGTDFRVLQVMPDGRLRGVDALGNEKLLTPPGGRP